MNENIKAGGNINGGDGGYNLSTQERYEEFKRSRMMNEQQPAPVQEPVAVVTGYHGGNCVVAPTNPAQLFNSGTAFYTAPPAQQKPWVDLSDEEIDALAELHGLDYMSYDPFVRALEQLLKEKNT
jgi:hypothetical protein